MWLLKNLSINSNKDKVADKGTITVSNQGGLNVKTSQDHIGVPVVSTYGIDSKPPIGENIVVLPVGENNVCIGYVCKGEDLEEGEIKLFSKGGASLILKNDGRILANGVDITGGGL